MKRIIKSLGVLILVTSLFGCKKYLDVNQNTNDPSDVTPQELLPAAQASIAQVLGNYLQIVGGVWAEYWTQNPNASQYRSLEQYQPGPSSANNAWTELYAGALTDLNRIVQKTDTTAQSKNYRAIAKILQAYTFQLLTDNFGDLPFSEAIKADENNTNPKFDKQQDVYKGIIQLAKEGRNLCDETASAPGSDDLIYSGDMSLWRKFANTLLLRMYLRMVYVDEAAAKQGIAALEAENAEFLQEGETAQITYKNSAGFYNPLYSEMVGLDRTQNLVASTTGITPYLERLDTSGNPDPRIDVFYYYNNTNYASLEQGYYNTPTPGGYSLPGFAVGGVANPPSDIPGAEQTTASAPVKFLSSYESLFLQAEAAQRGYLTSESAQSLYERAITANFDEFGLLPDYQDYLDYYLTDLAPFTAAPDPIETIITEKWLAMNGNQNIEAWTERRRTGFPTFFVISKNSRIGSNYPVRIPYPETELTRNINFPGQKEVTERVWWDVN